MRPLGLSLLLPLAACFSPHGMAASGTDGTSNGASTGTSDPNPTTTSPTATTHGGTVTTDTFTATTDVTTTAPLTSTTDASTSSDTTGEPATAGTIDPNPVCSFAMAGDQTRHVLQLNKGNTPIMQCATPMSWIGPVKIMGGTLLMTEDPMCMMGLATPDLAIGENWPSTADREYPCARATVYWADLDNECRIGALEVVSHGPNPVEPDLLFAASLSHPTKPEMFMLWPARILQTPCGCEQGTGCCAPDDAGEYNLEVTEMAVPSGTNQAVQFNAMPYHFANIQSYVGPGCQDDPSADLHFDWFIEKQ